MEAIIKLPETLIPQIEQAAKYEGYHETEGYILHIIQEKLIELSNRVRIIEITDRVSDRLKKTGIPEEEIQKDFDKFRNRA